MQSKLLLSQQQDMGTLDALFVLTLAWWPSPQTSVTPSPPSLLRPTAAPAPFKIPAPPPRLRPLSVDSLTMKRAYV